MVTQTKLFRNDTTTATTHSRICQGFLRASRSELRALWKSMAVLERLVKNCKNAQTANLGTQQHCKPSMHHLFSPRGIATSFFKINFILQNFSPKVFRTQALRRVSQRATPPRCQTLRSTKPQAMCAEHIQKTKIPVFFGNCFGQSPSGTSNK